MRTFKLGIYGIIPFVSGTNFSTDYSNEVLHWLFDSQNKWSLPRYWSEASGGAFQFDTSVFDMIFLEGQDYVGRLRQPSRSANVAAAVQILFELGYDPNPYDVLVFVIPGTVDASATWAYFGGRSRPAVLYNHNGAHSFMAHELGHTLGLHHPFDTNIPNPTFKYGEYGDPTCIMSANSFGGFPVSFPIPEAQRTLLNGNNPFWSQAGPGVSMATLWRYAPEFPAPQPFSTELAANGTPVSKRLFLAGKSGPCLFTMATAGPNSWYTVEYRRGDQWDQRFRYSGHEGVIIHQIRETIGSDSDGPGWPIHQQVCLAGVIPLPSTGRLDWSDDKFAVRVVKAAAGWVDIVVGATITDIPVTITTENTITVASEVPAEEVTVSRTGSNCGTSTYTAIRQEQFSFVDSEIISSGFKDPAFRYELNGQKLNDWTKPEQIKAGSILLTVAVSVPVALGTSVTRIRTIEVFYNAKGRTIRLTFCPGNGVYNLTLVGFVGGNPSSEDAGTASAPVELAVTTALIRLPVQAIVDQTRCIKRIADELRNRKHWPPLKDEHPDWRLPKLGVNWTADDLATFGRRLVDAVKFERQNPTIGFRVLSDASQDLDMDVDDLRQIGVNIMETTKFGHKQ